MKQFEPTFLGRVVADWRTMHLKRIGRLKGGAGFPHDEQGVTDAEIPFYKVKHLQSPRYLSESDNFVSAETARKLGAEILPPDTIIFAKVGAALLLNRFRVLTIPSCIDNNMTGLVFDHRCERDFLFYLLNQIEFSELFNQGPVPSVNSKQAGYITIPLPPLPEQKRIAAYLDACCAAIDRAVESKLKQLETLDALRKSIIQRAVTQGLNPKVKMKLVPMDGVGLVPDHWRVKQLRYVCQISYGITLQLESGKTDGVPILTVQNLDIHGDWKFDNEFCIDEELVHEDDILKHGDLLFNWRNGSARHVGKTAFFDLDGRYTHVSFLLRMRCGKDLSPFFLKSYLGALRMAGFFEGSKDKVNKTFNSTELNRLSVLVPPIEEQKEIVEIVQEKSAEIENIRKVIEDQISTLTAYRKSLIHECVTGKRRISNADVTRAAAHV